MEIMSVTPARGAGTVTLKLDPPDLLALVKYAGEASQLYTFDGHHEEASEAGARATLIGDAYRQLVEARAERARADEEDEEIGGSEWDQAWRRYAYEIPPF